MKNAVTEEGCAVDKPAAAHKKNFETLCRAIKNGEVALMEVQLAATGEIVAAIVATNSTYGKPEVEQRGKRKRVVQHLQEMEFVPFAIMLNGNPYKLLNPPNPDGGFVSQKEAWSE